MSDDTRKPAATIRDVARVAQVSMTTVSHALSAKRPVSPETAERIQAAIEHLGYVPHSGARALHAGKSLMLGLVVPDVSDPFFGRLAASVERAADEADYGVVLGGSSGASSREARYFNLLRSRSIDGLIYVAGALRHDDRLSKLAQSHPIVLADEWVEGLDGIPLAAADHEQGGRLAGEHLASLGHRDVAVLTGRRGLRSAEERVAGFHSIYPDALVVDADFSEEVAYHRTAKLLARGGAGAPTAIFASNDLAAFGVLDAARDHGLVVPRDLSVVGFDDVPLAQRVSPPLTTVRQPIDEIGRLATATLFEVIAGRDPGELERCPVELVVRESTAPPAHTN
ncbi:LacI family DNA-binding transcriptional regulator [Agromyces albus]|uniref:LacI family DNA-binding transcriptional regulator n=1 Tax=Agromyces albus TaxID=205332 RepID=UPI002789B3DE|nr:LacI family DNA-binding transcriptional regulator [Agromyces albus]MDQ0577554.1 LacI family transcriptional regulator [Agromyces albus]